MGVVEPRTRYNEVNVMLSQSMGENCSFIVHLLRCIANEEALASRLEIGGTWLKIPKNDEK